MQQRSAFLKTLKAAGLVKVMLLSVMGRKKNLKEKILLKKFN